MNSADTHSRAANAPRTWDEPLEVVVVGAGFAGLYMLHALREAGFRAVVFEAGADVGGTWYWNRYPGARCDVESLDYSYKFSEELQREWQWSERYAQQEEILRYIHHVADRFDLRRDIHCNAKVTAAHYDDASNMWTLRTNAHDVVRARFVVMATGCLSTTNVPAIAGLERFRGEHFHTGHWPKSPVSFAGKRVAVIGTGSSGVQTIVEVAKEAAQLTVFQRTPNFCLPAAKPELDEEERRNYRERFREMREIARHSQYGTPLSDGLLIPKSALADDEATRTRNYQERWDLGGAALVRSYNDILLDADANKTAADFVRAKIREAVKDPDTAAALSPTDHHIGTKRLCLSNTYYETYNQPHVRLVDLKREPIEEIVENGVRTRAATYAFDALVFATGFDAVTGTLLRIDFQGSQGQRLSDSWAAGPRTYLGVMTHGFPNLFLMTGPGSPSITGNVMVNIEQNVEWMVDCLTWLRENGLKRMEARLDAQDAWVEHVNELAAKTLLPTANSWYMGANIPGKPRVFMPYIGGIGTYRRKCDEVANAGYTGFTASDA